MLNVKLEKVMYIGKDFECVFVFSLFVIERKFSIYYNLKFSIYY